MGQVLLRANEMDREDCTCGEESSSWESQSVTLYGVFHTWCINGFNCSRLVTLIKYISGYIDILVFSTALEKKNWALHGEQWVYEQVKIVSSRRFVNHFVRLHLLEEMFIIRLYVLEFPR